MPRKTYAEALMTNLIKSKQECKTNPVNDKKESKPICVEKPVNRKKKPQFKTTLEQEKATPKRFTFLNIDHKQKKAEREGEKRVQLAKKTKPYYSMADFKDHENIFKTVLKLPFISIFSTAVNEGVKRSEVKEFPKLMKT